MLRNELHLVTFHSNVFLSLWTFQSILIIIKIIIILEFVLLLTLKRFTFFVKKKLSLGLHPWNKLYSQATDRIFSMVATRFEGVGLKWRLDDQYGCSCLNVLPLYLKQPGLWWLYIWIVSCQ